MKLCQKPDGSGVWAAVVERGGSDELEMLVVDNGLRDLDGHTWRPGDFAGATVYFESMKDLRAGCKLLAKAPCLTLQCRNGGKREGAGRKKSPPAEWVTVSLESRSVERARQLAKTRNLALGRALGVMIDEAIASGAWGAVDEKEDVRAAVSPESYGRIEALADVHGMTKAAVIRKLLQG